jgi:putative transposase
MGRSRYKIFESDYPYFLTATIIEWMPLFGIKEIAQIVIDSLNFLVRNKTVEIYAYVLMENHLHLIAVSSDLAGEMKKFKSFTARKIIDYLEEKNYSDILQKLEFFKLRHRTDREYQFWQEGIHPEQITDFDMLRQKIDYIHNNPINRGFVDIAEHWNYSSARDYNGVKGLVEVETEWM